MEDAESLSQGSERNHLNLPIVRFHPFNTYPFATTRALSVSQSKSIFHSPFHANLESFSLSWLQIKCIYTSDQHRHLLLSWSDVSFKQKSLCHVRFSSSPQFYQLPLRESQSFLSLPTVAEPAQKKTSPFRLKTAFKIQTI